MRVPLRILLTVPFSALIVLTVVATGFFSFYNGQSAVKNVTDTLRQRVISQINDHLRTELQTPFDIDALNADNIAYDVIAPNDVQTFQRFLLRRVELYPSISSIYFGDINGQIVGSGREGANGSYYVYSTDQNNTFRKYSSDDQGNTGQLMFTVNHFDPRTRPWYLAAVQARTFVWNQPYVLATGQDMAIAASRPVYNAQQQLIGVISIDIFLSQLSNFLSTLDIGEAGSSYILDTNGMLIAVSQLSQSILGKDSQGKVVPTLATQSSIDAVRETTRILITQYGDLHNLPASRLNLNTTIHNATYYVDVLPLKEPGISWFVVVVIPESTFMAQIDANNRLTVAIICISLLAALTLSIGLNAGIARLISQLDTSARSLTAGEWPPDLSTTLPINELSHLAAAFNQMKHQVRTSLDNLTIEVQERKRIESALRKNEEQYRRLFETVSDAIVIYDAETRQFIDVNDSALEIYGYARDVFLALRFDDLAGNPAGMDGDYVNAARHLKIPLVFQKKNNGMVFPAESSSNTFVLEGRVVICAITRDITEQLEAQLELEKYQRHLEDLVTARTESLQIANTQLTVLGRMKDEFVSNVSHELRNPITSLLLRTQLGKMQPEKWEDHLGVIERETNRLHRTIEDLLHLSRLDQDRMDMVLRAVNLNTLIKAYAQDRSLLAEAKRLQLAVVEEEPMPLVLADAGMIEETLGILLTNAINYTPAGGNITIATCQHIEAETEWAGFSVSDTGPGISKSDQVRLFERFFRGAAGRQSRSSGTGLGLAIAKEIVDRHHGRIEVVSKGIAGEGATFTVWLPGSSLPPT
jgi:PAS domain S-box-containing protein